MSVYNDKDLYNKYVQQEASDAFHRNCIDEETFKNVLQSSVSHLYTPNLFIRIALGLLTIVAVFFSSLFIWLIFEVANPESYIFICLTLAALCYTMLEVMIKQKNYYNAGVDNVLMCFVIIFIASAFFINDFNDQFLIVSPVLALACAWMCVRFRDAFMACLSYLFTFIFLFLLYLKTGSFARLSAPFVMMLFSAVVYFIAKRSLENYRQLIYHFSFESVMLLALITFYASGNYYVVKELSNEMFNLNAGLNDPLPYGWIFWIFTFTVPATYIFYGVYKKDSLLFRTGLVLAVVAVLTFQNYYPILPGETLMLLSGIIVMLASYVLMKYLKTPKYGYTFLHTGRVSKNVLDAEAIIIAQVFGKKGNPQNITQFGGGSSGGGGAAGNF